MTTYHHTLETHIDVSDLPESLDEWSARWATEHGEIVLTVEVTVESVDHGFGSVGRSVDIDSVAVIDPRDPTRHVELAPEVERIIRAERDDDWRVAVLWELDNR